jgi:hypothetical protein
MGTETFKVEQDDEIEGHDYDDLALGELESSRFLKNQSAGCKSQGPHLTQRRSSLKG